VPPALPDHSWGRALAPRYWPVHLLAIAALTANILLGLWQYHVWQDHRAENAASVTTLAPVPLDTILGPDSAYPDAGLGRPVVVAGTWDPGQSVLISGRVRAGRTGFWVVTPVTTASGSEIPVVRGWVAQAGQAPAAPTGAASLVGLLQPSDESGTPDSDPRDDVLPELSITDLLQRTTRDLYGGYVVATDRRPPGGTPAGSSSGTSGLAPAAAENLPGADASTALRNLLYAIQWWIFGAFVVLMWWRWVVEDVLGRGRTPPL
jgi:surfeit locus 1 family protein